MKILRCATFDQLNDPQVQQMDKRNNILSQVEELLLFGNALADASRALILEQMHSGFSVALKIDKSLVTNTDKAAEILLRNLISTKYPAHSVIGEELVNTAVNSPFVWYLDPIDGTEEFVNGMPTFGSIISLHYYGEPVVGIIDHPALDVRTVSAYRRGTFCNGYQSHLNYCPSNENIRLGISKKANFFRRGDQTRTFDKLTASFPNIRIFDSCFAYTCAANGSLDAMVDFNVRSWDISASKIAVEEAGGSFVVIDSSSLDPLISRYSIVFGKSEVVKEIINSLKE